VTKTYHQKRGCRKPTECSPTLFEFARVEGRTVIASFDGGQIISDAGALCARGSCSHCRPDPGALAGRVPSNGDLWISGPPGRPSGVRRRRATYQHQRITVAVASACPWRHEFALAHAYLRLSRHEPDSAQEKADTPHAADSW
jgi:hypothetical protein